ncbi:cell division protein ZipA [Bowmanella dokdonensis]|uniref:Cell division protein ZipA n=1 Tax=Bowmanella dokdonensis TaxID=751969 RepID=A0A939IPM9_9ALTE|nr:cell division protein ZipA [Bowmanella dokdonensis]MBN7827608.1 cell division protein ZipA [Bowmanella dokdonensis]
MEELRLTFLIFGALAIAGILVHGLWTVRKKNRSKTGPGRAAYLKYERDADESLDSDFEPDEGGEPQVKDFDDLGLGPVRVIKSEPRLRVSETEDFERQSESTSAAPAESVPPVVRTEGRSEKMTEPKAEQPAGRVSMPEPPTFLLRQGGREQAAPVHPAQTPPKRPYNMAEPSRSAPPKAGLPPDTSKRQEPTIGSEPVAAPADETRETGEEKALQTEPQETVRAGLAEQARNLVKRKKSEPPKRREPSLNKARADQMRIDFDDEPKTPPVPEKTAEKAETGKSVSQEVLVLNVKAPDNKPIPGATLLPALLTLGFKFGEQDIFHRHVNSNGKGPVLFSLANMFKPGVFDIDSMETFTTQGVSLFMILPIEGDPHQVFNMMHNAARKLADEFGAQVLDGRRSALTKQSLQQYVEKIREFERKRMIRKAN